jgi:hypothetical protein
MAANFDAVHINAAGHLITVFIIAGPRIRLGTGALRLVTRNAALPPDSPAPL